MGEVRGVVEARVVPRGESWSSLRSDLWVGTEVGGIVAMRPVGPSGASLTGDGAGGG